MTTEEIKVCKRDTCTSPRRAGGALCLECFWKAAEKDRRRPLIQAAAAYRQQWERGEDDPAAGAELLLAWQNLLSAVKHWHEEAIRVGREIGRPEVTEYKPFQISRKSSRGRRIKAAAHACAWLIGTEREQAALEALHYAAATSVRFKQIQGVEPAEE